MRKVYLILIGLVFATSIFAQSRTVSGIVIDETGEPLIGVSVIIKNQPGVGVKTGLDGDFKISVANGETLQFSYVGYQKAEHQVLKSETELRVQLKPDEKMLETVTIIGQQSQSKVSVVGSVSTIDVKELQVPATSINNMIGGRIPGIVSLQTSGEPGKNISQFWVRGIGTFGVNSGALVLIDGLEGSLDQIDPADVQSFSVLKDASATAVYGNRGANGVVLVTTKRGQEGKLTITARANYTVSQLKRMPEYLRAADYAALANEASIQSGNPLLYNDMAMKLIVNGLDRDIYPDVNWQKEILNPVSFQQTYFLNASGGGSIARYYISTGYSNESAAYKQDPNSKFKNGVGFQRFTYRSNIDVNLTKTTTLDLGLDGYIENTTSPGFTNTDQLWYLTRTLTPLLFPTKYSTGQFPTSGKENTYSPYTMLNETGFSARNNSRNMVTLAVNQDLGMITKGLKARFQVASDYRTYLTEGRSIIPEMFTAMGRSSTGELQLAKTVFRQDVRYSRDNNVSRKYYLESQLNWNRDFGVHNLGALLYHYLQDEVSTFTGLDNTGIGNIPFRSQGLSARLTYGLRNTYFLDLNFGYTGSENFRRGEQYGFFPSVALGWVATEYDFMKENLPWLSFLKFRGSYGTAGNANIANIRFPYQTKVNSNAGSTWGHIGGGISISQLGADNLRWEVSLKQNAGVDMNFFKDRLKFTADVFRDIRDNIFQQKLNIPGVAGYITTPYGNVGSMYSYGTDGNFSFYQPINKEMDFTIRGNYTFATNYVKHYDEAQQPYEYLNRTGYPWGVQRGYIAMGLFESEEDIATSPTQTFGKYRVGDTKYNTINGDGRINKEDRVPLAHSSEPPRFMYGFGGEFRYKQFTVGMMFRGTGQADYFRAGTGFNDGWIPFYNGNQGNVLSIFKDKTIYWSPENPNPNAMFPRLSYGNNENNSQLSTFWKADGSYLRFQELNLAYTMAGYDFFKPLGISSINFQLVANNLFTIDKVKYFDPEQARYNGGAYPIPARYSLQLYVNF